jgi:hypothetical protein
MGVILRDSSKVDPVKIDTDDVDDSTAIDLRDMSSGILIVKTDPGNITIYVSDSENGTYYLLSDSKGAALSVMTTGGANEAIAFPDELFAAHWLKFKSATADVADAVVMLKG